MHTPKLASFTFEETTIRIIWRNSAPWFVVADVCRAVGIKNPADALSALDDDEKGIDKIYTPGGPQDMLVVAEGGMYTMLMRGHLAARPGTLPHRFRRWVMSEVLPTIRETGQYRMPSNSGDNARTLPEMDRVRMTEAVRRIFGKRAAQQAWIGLGLPIFAAMQEVARQGDLFNLTTG